MTAPLAFPLVLALALAAAMTQDTPRVLTNRPTGRELLKLPKEEDAFGFVVYGDRTGGPVEGIEVLKQAVADTNLLDPDLVMTVGDLVNGYNANDAWRAQAAEYKAAMAKLRMPWFPVAGNHDVYWRGPDKPPGEHERNFETVFGPLWYAVQHKKCWFVVLYSDEGNPTTGEKNFNKPECQRISEAQFDWLTETLQKAKGARHVFVFLHHPRWLAQYGTDWERVHALLAKNGNVTAVFAGHIHRMRYDGTKDGIQYYTVASVGASLEFEAPAAGYLHQFHVVTVRPQGITVAALPVGTVMDPQQITGQLSEDVDLVHTRLKPVLTECVAAGSGEPVSSDGSVDAVITLRCDNPATRAIDLELVSTPDNGWVFSPDHQHLVVPPGKSATTRFAVQRAADPKLPYALPILQLRCDYLAKDRRVPLPVREFPLELPPPADLGAAAQAREGVLVLDGKSGCLRVAASQLPLPDGPFTIETWLRGQDFKGRRGLLAKTESSEYALFCSDGIAEFSVWIGDGYVRAGRKDPLTPDEWHHVAGVFDGSKVRCYVDGELAAEVDAKGKRKANNLPLFIGADTTKAGAPTSHFTGAIDEVRLSKVARYSGPKFEPKPRHEADADTVLLLHLDSDFGPWTPDASQQKAHATRLGSAQCKEAAPPLAR
ncbi:MAG TPA: LamG-like jellyroll fold domain-containing protein [Planctomycetota bacterium]